MKVNIEYCVALQPKRFLLNDSCPLLFCWGVGENFAFGKIFSHSPTLFDRPTVFQKESFWLSSESLCLKINILLENCGKSKSYQKNPPTPSADFQLVIFDSVFTIHDSQNQIDACPNNTTGFSSKPLNVRRNSDPDTPSTTLWSQLSVTFITFPATI